MASLLARIARGTRHEPTGIALNVQTLGELFNLQKQGIWAGIDWNPQENIEGNTASLVQSVHKTYGPVPAAVIARALLLGQFRPLWRDRNKKMFGTPALAPLERPMFTTRVDLLRRVEHDASYAGTAYVHRTEHIPSGLPGLRNLSPERTRIVVNTGEQISRLDLANIVPADLPDAYVAGYQYNITGKPGPQAEYRYYTTDQVAHWAPEPDPSQLFAGTSWVASVLRDIQGDKQVASHIDGFLERGAIPGLAVTFPLPKADELPMTADDLDAYEEVIGQYHSGPGATGKSLILAGGAQVIPIGSGLDSLMFKDITAGYEAHIASRARIPPTVLGIREGMQGSGLNQGNYSSARRQWGDGWVHPSLESLAAALEPLLNRPAGVELWYEATAVMFLQEDAKDAADIASRNAAAIMQLISSGYEPDAAATAVATGDMSGLVGQHTGLPSVQLQQPIAVTSEEEE